MYDERPRQAAEKIVTVSRLRRRLSRSRREGKTIVWTNGCFDLLHAGHVLYLERARRLGDILVVGLNSDASVRAIKGPDRPYVPQQQRACVLAGLEAVDYVVIFEETTAVRVLQAIRPHIYAKGGDYTLETLEPRERELVEKYGGKIVILPQVEGLSTTGLTRQIREKETRPTRRSRAGLTRSGIGKQARAAIRRNRG